MSEQSARQGKGGISAGGRLAAAVDSLRPPDPGPLLRWLAAPALVGFAFLVQALLLETPSIAPFVFFYFAVAMAGWIGGRLPSLLAVAISTVVANYYFLPPLGALSLHAEALRATGLFLLGATPVGILCGSFREALIRAERSADVLARQADLLHLSHDAVFVWKLSGAIESWNRGAEELYGFTAERAVGQLAHDLLRTVFPEPLEDVERKLREAGRWQGRLQHLTRDGRKLWVSSRMQLVHGRHGVDLVLETNRDITEQVRAEDDVRRLNLDLGHQNAELSESEERFRALADNITQLAWMADASGGIFWYNRRWFEYTGTTLPEMKGWGWQKVHHPDHVDRVVSKLVRCFATGEPWEDTFPLRAPDGTYRWFLSRAVPIHDAEGRVTRWFGTSTDITEQRVAEQRKDEFLAMLSHELRNPLAPIRNALYLLGRVPPGGERARRALSVIERQIQHMTRLVGDLLDVSRISRGKIQIHRAPVDLNAVVARAADDNRTVFGVRQIAFTSRVTSESMQVVGDADRLYQVVGNLLHNAAKFTPHGGHVELTLTREDGFGVLRVKDTGVGIPADMLATIFQPFAQASEALDRRAAGLGLGLALVRELVSLHGGTVEAASEGPDRGAELTVRLPAELAKTTAPEEEVPPPASGRRVLVIEDNIDAAESLRDALAVDAHEVAVAYDGAEGVEKARAFAPEVVLCDIGLPGMDGYAVARALRAYQATRGMTLVALTGYALAQDEQRAHEAGFDRHLAKPPDLDKLQRILVEASRRAARREDQTASETRIPPWRIDWKRSVRITTRGFAETRPRRRRLAAMRCVDPPSSRRTEPGRCAVTGPRTSMGVRTRPPSRKE
jgi:PAS domain S-box-containing protein